MYIKVCHCVSYIADDNFIFYLQLDNIGQQELASRLQMNCMKSYVEPQKLNNVNVLIMDVSKLSAGYLCYVLTVGTC